MKIPTLIARERECETLQECLDSDRSELVIICGRRRVGKTFLVDQFFNYKYDFTYTGGNKFSTSEQLRNFAKALKKHTGQTTRPKFNDWFEAFDALEEYLETLPQDRKKVIFIDEMPWIDKQRSQFVKAFENFWNGWANRRYDILLIATGSATSWMAEKIEKNKGGLHQRITARLYLKPFSLKETEQYLKYRKIKWDRYQILQAYMLTGGVPLYLSFLNPKLSIAQNIDLLCFAENGALKREFDELYDSLFPHAENYIEVVRLLYNNKKGLSKKEIAEETKFNGKTLKAILENLVQCSFVTVRSQFKKNKEALYRLTDFYTIFYFKFIEDMHTLHPTWWTDNVKTPDTLSWMGRAFELICLQHYQQIKNALSIGGISCDIYSWRYLPNKTSDTSDDEGAQIDMVIDRADHCIMLCEMKFSIKRYNMKSSYEKKIRERGWLFQDVTGTKKTVLHTFVTTYGISNPENWDIVHSEVTMDDLFNS